MYGTISITMFHTDPGPIFFDNKDVYAVEKRNLAVYLMENSVWWKNDSILGHFLLHTSLDFFI